MHRVCWSFDTPIAAEIVAAAVPVLLQIRFVVLLVVADKILQGEAIVAGNEVHAGLRPAIPGLVRVAAPRQPRGEISSPSGFSSPEVPDGIAILVIPFAPARWETSGLVPAGPKIPGLRDEL